MTDATRLPRWLPLALALVIFALYAPALRAPFIGYDDPWLVRDNPLLRDASLGALRSIWTRFDLDTRMVLGAEFLPVRDTAGWLIARIAGVSPLPFRLAQLAVYIAAALALRAWLHRVMPDRGRVVELAAWLFALHPAHVSSVAWVAGLKDALSLLFLALALRAHAGASRARTPAVAALTALACLSKGTSVIAPAMLVLSDLLARRRVAWRPVLASGLVAALSVLVQTRIGKVVGIFAAPFGEGPLGRIASIAPVFVRYARIALLLDPPCIVREASPRAITDPIALASLAAIAGIIALAVLLWRRGHRLALLALGIFAVGLGPVSQVLAPLQNRIADRYLLVAVLGPCLAVAALVARAPKRAHANALGAAAIVACGAFSALHVAQFADELWLWSDGVARTAGPLAPYQRAHLLRARGDVASAERDFREALRRDGLRTATSTQAATNLAQILAPTGRADEAVALLRRTIPLAPRNPRGRYNLASLLHARGDEDEARAVLREVVVRFPDYPRARTAWVRWYGPLPPDAPPPPATARYAYDPYAR